MLGCREQALLACKRHRVMRCRCDARAALPERLHSGRGVPQVPGEAHVCWLAVAAWKSQHATSKPLGLLLSCQQRPCQSIAVLSHISPYIFVIHRS